MRTEIELRRLVEDPNREALQAWMLLGAADVGGYDLITSEDLSQRFALAPYIRMYEKEGVSLDELTSRLEEDAITYVEESVLKVKLGQRYFDLQGGDLYSGKFGGKSFLTMCRDTVIAREKNGLDTERAKHEGLGVANIVKLLEVTSPGQVVVLVSPPDESDENMGDYSMVYLYLKEDGNRVWFGAVRDENRQIEDWQEFAKEQSLWQTDWSQYDHKKFVALPFVAKDGLRQVLIDLGVDSAVEVPTWIKREARKSAEMIISNVGVGNRNLAQKVLDAFKIAVITGRQQTSNSDTGFSVARIVLDYNYGLMINRMFENNGGQQIIAAGGACGGDQLMTQWGENVSMLDENVRQNNVLSSVMGVNEKEVLSTKKTTKESASSGEIHITLSDGTSYVLKIREGWKCAADGCNRVSSHDTGVRIGECHICEYCDPNVHRGE